MLGLDASAGGSDVVWDAARRLVRDGAAYDAYRGVAVAFGGGDDYALEYDLAFDGDGRPAFVNVSHPLWISTAARVDGFSTDVDAWAFDIPETCQNASGARAARAFARAP